MKTMANKRFWSVILVFVLVFNVVLTGCTSTTSSINYASAAQPKGEYKHVSVTVQSSFDKGSVLQRFYAAYPSDKYEVIAIEKQDKGILRIASALGGVLLGGVIGFAIDSPGEGKTLSQSSFPIFTGTGAVLLGAGGFFAGNIFFKDDYIITYVER